MRHRIRLPAADMRELCQDEVYFYLGGEAGEEELRVLDVGAGNGMVGEELKKHGMSPFNIKESFFDRQDDSGFSQLIRELIISGYLDLDGPMDEAERAPKPPQKDPPQRRPKGPVKEPPDRQRPPIEPPEEEDPPPVKEPPDRKRPPKRLRSSSYSTGASVLRRSGYSAARSA